MRIGIVGGLDRNQPQLLELAHRAGHEVEFHTGITGGRGIVTLGSLVRRSDLIVMVMEVNSHAGVQVTRKLCNQQGTPSMVLRTCTQSRFSQLLDAIATHREHVRKAG